MSRFLRACLVVLGAAALPACDQLGPRASDDLASAGDAAPGAPDAGGLVHLLPPGSPVPSIAADLELSNQVRIFDGLDDDDLAEAGGVLERQIGKADGANLRYWSFGAIPMVDGRVVKAPAYLLVADDGEGSVTPVAGHPILLDSIPGDLRYSAIRQIVHVPVTPLYRGEVVATVDALGEALALGLVEEPRPSGTWRNMPVVATGIRLDVGGTAEPLAAGEALARGYRVEVFELGWEQPLRNNQIPIGQSSRLLSGVATGDPPALPTTPDPLPVFEYGIPPAMPTDSFNYTPVTTEILVRLASGVAPADIDQDDDLFTRSGSGSITGYLVDTVASFAITTTTLNQPIQFAEGSP